MVVVVVMVGQIRNIVIYDIDDGNEYLIVMMMGYHCMCQYENIGQYDKQCRNLFFHITESVFVAKVYIFFQKGMLLAFILLFNVFVRLIRNAFPVS